MSNIITLLTQFIQNLYLVTGVLGIVLAMAIESCLIPLPSEIIMPLAGTMITTGMLGINPHLPLVLNLILLAFAGSLGSLLGSLAAYWIGYAGGRPVILKYGKYILISQHDADKADRFFQRWGTPTAFFSRMLPVVRTYISLPAGITRMSVFKFSIYTFLGSLPWCLLLAFLGYQLGQHYEQISGPLHYLDGVIVVLVVVLVVLYVWRHIRNDRRARAEHAAAEAQAARSQQSAGNPWGQPSFQGQPPVSRSPLQGQGQGLPFSPPASQQSWGAPPVQPWGQSQPRPQSIPQQWSQSPVPPAQAQPQWGQPSAPVPPVQPQSPQPRNPGQNGWQR